MGGALLTTRGSIDLRFIKVIYSPKQAEVQQTIEKGPPVSDAWGSLGGPVLSVVEGPTRGTKRLKRSSKLHLAPRGSVTSTYRVGPVRDSQASGTHDRWLDPVPVG